MKKTESRDTKVDASLSAHLGESDSPVIVWFRHDLRLADNPALAAACSLKRPIIPVYIWAQDEEGIWRYGEASMWWLHYSLESLAASLAERGSSLLIRKGDSLEALKEIASETGARAIVWNRRYEPKIVERDTAIKESLNNGSGEVLAKSFNGNLLIEPWEISTAGGAPYQVFTPFWKSCQEKLRVRDPLPTPRSITPYAEKIPSISVTDLELLPRIDWAGGIEKMWTPGEKGAKIRLKEFLSGPSTTYKTSRDVPSEEGVSYLSPHLHFGEISPHTIWHAVSEKRQSVSSSSGKDSLNTYVKELGWREFAHHILYHFPETNVKPLRKQFENFEWRAPKREIRVTSVGGPISPAKNEVKGKSHTVDDELNAWQRGLTGYPIVDAGMRELWVTGWMHNRVRMIVASFLTKDLLISWTEGAKWFWDTLVDADLANNTLGWQWASGCGADAAPFFRIFNPTLQGEKFDADGEYVRRWVPELEKLPGKWIHKPWEAPDSVLKDAGVILGKTYPKPIVDHSAARKRALSVSSQKGTN